MKVYLRGFRRGFRPILANSFAIPLVLTMACSGVSSPSPPLSRDTAATIPTSTPTQTVNSTPNLTVSTTTVSDDRAFIQLTDPLDEPEYYCVDVPGAGRGVRLQSALQAHTCKPIATAADELFTMDHPNDGQIYMEAYDLCVEADEASTGSSLRLQPCSDSPLQLFALGEDLIRLSGETQDSFCWAVAPGSGIPTGGPSHLRRALFLEICDSVDPTLTRWSVGLFVY